MPGLEPDDSKRPETRRVDVTETIHGESISDPFRWLEDPTDSEVLEWVDAQNRYAKASLQTETHDALEPRMDAVAEVTTYGTVVVRGGTYFRTIEHSGDDHAILYVSDDPAERGTELVNPNTWPANQDEDNEPEAMSWYVPSWDGETLAYGVTAGGDEQYDIHIITVPDGEEIEVLEELGRSGSGGFAWDADNNGFRYVWTGDHESGRQNEKELRHRTMGGTEEVLFEHDDVHVWPGVKTEPESGIELVAMSEMSRGTDWHLADGANLEPILTGLDSQLSVEFQDETVFIHTDYDAPRKRILSCPIERFRDGEVDLTECAEVIPERETILDAFVTTPEHLIVHEQQHANSKLAVYTHEGTKVDTISVPPYSAVSGLSSNGDAEEVFFKTQGFDRPSTLYVTNPGTDQLTELAQVDIEVPVELTVDQVFIESSDGTEIPLYLCHRSDLELDGHNPTLLYGYGGFRISMTPGFGRFRRQFILDGGVYAQVCARGGSEYGEEWHEAAMGANKQNTYNDVIAAGEWLCESGYTSTDRLAFSGASNGGLTVGAVVTQRPDLWASAYCRVPLLDMLRFHEFLIGESWTNEYGHPEDADDFEHLREISPYHNVEPEKEYPAVLFKTATGDSRVHPAHAWKMTGRMQTEAGGGPFLLRTRTDTGHGMGQPTWMVVEDQTEKWTFLYETLGLEPESP